MSLHSSSSGRRIEQDICTVHKRRRDIPGFQRQFIAQSPLEDIKSIIPSFKTPSTSSAASYWTSFSSLFSSSDPSSSSEAYSLPFTLPDDLLVVGALSALAGMGLAVGGIAGYRRYWRRIRNANDVTGKMIDQKRWVRGVVTSVGDGGAL